MALAGISAEAKLRVDRARERHPLFDIAYRTFKRYSGDDAGTYAAALTYYMFFSIFPMLLFAIAVLGFVLTPSLQHKLINSGLKTVPLLGSILTRNALGTIEKDAGGLALLSIVLALYSGSGGIVAFGHALNRIAHVETERNFAGKRLVSL